MAGRWTGGVRLCALTALPALILWAPHVEAAGFAVRENSAAMLGNAFAGVPTNTEDISSIANNPALLGAFGGVNFSGAVSYISPDSKFQPGNATAAPAVGSPTITPNSNFSGNDDIGRDAFVPATYLSLSLLDDLKFGLAVTLPFGLLTDNPEGWIGRYHALKSDLKTADINPMLAYNVTDYLSVGGGFRAVYAEAELSQAIDFGSITAGAGGTPTQQDGRAKLQGDDWGFGGNAGIMFEPGKLYAPLQGLRLGVGYRSRVEINVQGDTTFDNAPAILTSAGQFVKTDTESEVDLPESVAFGAHYNIDDQWAVMGQVEWTNWSEFDELKVKFDNSQPDSITKQDWDDSWFFAAGVTHRPAWLEGLALRIGFAFDQTPVPDSTRTPRVPDEDRYWIAAGVNYSPAPWVSFDFGYTHIFMPDASINLEAESATDFRGSLSGEYESHIDIFAIQANLRF